MRSEVLGFREFLAFQYLDNNETFENFDETI